MGRSASSTRSQVALVRHLRKYYQTVSQGGSSWRIIRQGMSPRNTYRMLLITSRWLTVRGCPLEESGGSKVSSRPPRRGYMTISMRFFPRPGPYTRCLGPERWRHSESYTKRPGGPCCTRPSGSGPRGLQGNPDRTPQSRPALPLPASKRPEGRCTRCSGLNLGRPLQTRGPAPQSPSHCHNTVPLSLRRRNLLPSIDAQPCRRTVRRRNPQA
jgi:hypothetical protein